MQGCVGTLSMRGIPVPGEVNVSVFLVLLPVISALNLQLLAAVFEHSDENSGTGFTKYCRLKENMNWRDLEFSINFLVVSTRVMITANVGICERPRLCFVDSGLEALGCKGEVD